MRLKVFSPLSEMIGFKERELKLKGNLRIRDIIRDIPELAKVELGEFVVALNKTKVVSLDTEVGDEDELWILPPIDGG
jgi:molybdopterin converting factor small subunit